VKNSTLEDFEGVSENCGEYPNTEGVVWKGPPSITHVYLFESFRYYNRNIFIKASLQNHST